VRVVPSIKASQERASKRLFLSHSSPHVARCINRYELTREDFLRIAVEELGDWDVVVATTGFTSRELYELRRDFEHGHERDFLTVGSMGHASAIAAGIAIAKPSRSVRCSAVGCARVVADALASGCCCLLFLLSLSCVNYAKQVFTLDGDGAAIMHLGTMATMGKLALPNYKHVIINNAAHDSVGAQPTGGEAVAFTNVAEACGYTFSMRATTDAEIREGIHKLRFVAVS